MNKNKTLSGIIGLLIGYLVFILIVDAVSKPDNFNIAIKPVETIQTYFFSFVFTMGTAGWVLGSILFIGFLTLCYFLGTGIYKKIIEH